MREQNLRNRLMSDNPKKNLHITEDCFPVNAIHSIQQGDHRVFQQAFLQWQPKVYTYFVKRTKDNMLAEELTQLTFIKLWNFRHTLTGEHTLDTQLFRIARTTLIDGIRERERRRKLVQGLEAQPETPDNGLHQTAAASLELSSALNTLPPARKKVFLLHRVQGYSYKQIAGELSISDRTVEKHLALAIKQLRKILALSILLTMTRW